MIGGFSKNGIESDFKYWSELKVDFLMIGPAFDFFFDDQNIQRILRLKEKYNLNLLLHPRTNGNTFLTPANPDMHDKIFECLEIIYELILKNNLIPKVIMHLVTYNIPHSHYHSFSEEEALKNSKIFYEKFKGNPHVAPVFENVYPPHIGWGLFGYDSSHFSLFDLPKNSEFCFDVGHYHLSDQGIEDIQANPFPMTCMHLHSNNGKIDQHVPITKENFKEWDQIQPMISKDKFLVMEVKNEFELVERSLSQIRGSI